MPKKDNHVWSLKAQSSFKELAANTYNPDMWSIGVTDKLVPGGNVYPVYICIKCDSYIKLPRPIGFIDDCPEEDKLRWLSAHIPTKSELKMHRRNLSCAQTIVSQVLDK